MGAESLQQLMDLVRSLEEDNQKFYAGNNAAGTRLRKGLQEVKKLSQTMRNEVTITKANRKG